MKPTMTSTSSIPTVDAFLDGFPHPTITLIEGLLIYKSLLAVKELLKANAASVHTMCSYLGLILSAPVYNIIAPGTPFVIPNNPGLHPPNHRGTAAQIAQMLWEHNENLQQWKAYTNIHNTLKNNWSMPLSPSTYELIMIIMLALPTSTFVTSYSFFLIPMDKSL